MTRWNDQDLAMVMDRMRKVPRTVTRILDLATEGARVASKFKNVPTDGYASKKEAKRAAELKLLVRDGEITNLATQVRFELIPKQKGERACHYVADFVYKRDGKLVVEDCKGMRTPIYRIKRKLMLHVHGIEILET